MRAGAHLLLVAANPVNRGILRAVLEQPSASVAGHRYHLNAPGREMLFIAFVVELWLQSAPQGPIDFESREAELAVGALAGGWSGEVIHALAPAPLSLPQLCVTIQDLSRRGLERQLAAMQEAGQVEVRPDGSGGEIYALTDWLRAGIAPLIAAARLERRMPALGLTPIDALDVEAGFRCSLPLIALPAALCGTCSLGINLAEDESSSLTGVTVRIDRGRVIACTCGLDQKTDASAAASAGAWLDTVIEPDTKRVKTGGDRWLADAILEALHRTLFGVTVL